MQNMSVSDVQKRFNIRDSFHLERISKIRCYLGQAKNNNYFFDDAELALKAMKINAKHNFFKSKDEAIKSMPSYLRIENNTGNSIAVALTFDAVELNDGWTTKCSTQIIMDM